MKPIILNFLSVIRRFKVAVVLNVLGLSVAFAAFMVIMIQLDYDLGFDKFHKDSDKIFRVERASNTFVNALFSRPYSEAVFESSPQIIAGAITQSREQPAPFFVEKDGERHFYEENSLTVTPSFFDVFTFDFVEDTRGNYIAPGTIFIPLSMARKFFGNEPAIGKQIFHTDWGDQTIIGVYRDLPANSIFKNCIYFAMQDRENRDNWSNNNYHAYIRVNQSADVSQLFENFKRTFNAQAFWGDDFDWDKSGNFLRFTALPEIHFVTDVGYDSTPKSSKQTLMILFTIAIVIVAIAGINFTNFSTSLAPMRIKSINTQRVLGARSHSLRLSLVTESVITGICAYMVSLMFVLLFNTTSLAMFVDGDLSLLAHPLIVGGTALIALFTGLVVGLYPAFFMTSFAPAMALSHRSFGLSPKGKKMRNSLIGIQYIASFALIIGASFLYLQNYFMQQSPLGYDKEELITANIGKILSSREAFTNQLKAYSGIEDVTYGEILLSSSDQYMGWGRPYKGERIQFQCLPVHYTFLKVMGIEITEGRDFRAEDANRQSGVFVFNETARMAYNMEVGTAIGGLDEGDVVRGEIIGFIPDLKFASFRTEVEPMAFYVWGTENWGTQPAQAYIKVKAGADKRAAMAFIHSTLTEFGAEYTFNVRFYDEVLQQLYEKEIALGSLITLFSLLAIFISIVGVFGLVIFDSECRRKEVAIRKVLGASVTGIILMFNKAYFRILAVCFVVAAPLAWYAVHRWLQHFAYKTPMYWWVYLLAFAAVGIITAVTVTFQNWRVATDDPVNAIKSE